jgi:DAK2 domain fusion protein YloV
MDSNLTAADTFLGMFSSSVVFFKRHVDAINSLNVFPVPDGDTGTNMYGTLNGIQSRMSSASYNNLYELMDQLAEAALYEGRGNSGIILAQIFQGLVEHLSCHRSKIDFEIIAGAINNARLKAFKSVKNPFEGTMLTVLSDVATKADSLKGKKLSVKHLFQSLVKEAEKSVNRTPELLPILKESGVVDSGGYGLEVMLKGMLIFLDGSDPNTFPIALRFPEEDGAGVENLISDHFGSEDDFGYCTQFLLDTSQNLQIVEKLFEGIGNSTVIVGEQKIFRIHIHTLDPGNALSKAIKVGSIASISIENMETQSQEILNSSRKREPRLQIDLSDQTALLSIVNGDGIVRMNNELGVDLVIDGGLDMNPSVDDIVSAVNQVKADSILLLTNDKNVIPAANQAAELLISTIEVLPTETQVQGLECLFNFDPDISALQNKEIMGRLIPHIKTIAIFRSSRSVKINGVKVDQQQPMVMVEGEIHKSGNNLDELFLEVIREELRQSVEHVMVLLGNGMNSSDIERINNFLDHNMENFEEDVVELHIGGQPHYDYLISVLSN